MSFPDIQDNYPHLPFHIPDFLQNLFCCRKCPTFILMIPRLGKTVPQTGFDERYPTNIYTRFAGYILVSLSSSEEHRSVSLAVSFKSVGFILDS